MREGGIRYQKRSREAIKKDWNLFGGSEYCCDN